MSPVYPSPFHPSPSCTSHLPRLIFTRYGTGLMLFLAYRSPSSRRKSRFVIINQNHCKRQNVSSKSLRMWYVRFNMSRGNVTFMRWCHATRIKNNHFDWPLQHAAQSLHVGLDPVWFPKTWDATTKLLIRRLANFFSRYSGMTEWNGMRWNNDWTSSSSITLCILSFPPKKFHAAVHFHRKCMYYLKLQAITLWKITNE